MNDFYTPSACAPVKYGKLRFDRRYSTKAIAGKTFVYAALCVITALFIVPYLWLIFSSFKTPDQFSSPTFNFLPRDENGNIRFVLQNYVDAWAELNIPTVFLNTMIVCVVNTAANLFLNALAAYAFARMQFAGRDKIFLFSLTSMMVPGCVMLVPNFLVINYLGLYDNLLALILPYLMSVYNVFLLRQQFLAVEKEIEEAAYIDGAGYFTVFFKICLPIVKPMMIVLGISTFMWNYNNYLWPLLVLDSESNYTLSLSLGTLMYNGSSNSQMFPIMLAGAVMVSAPMIIVFFCLQKYILGGTQAGAVKG